MDDQHRPVILSEVLAAAAELRRVQKLNLTGLPHHRRDAVNATVREGNEADERAASILDRVAADIIQREHDMTEHPTQPHPLDGQFEPPAEALAKDNPRIPLPEIAAASVAISMKRIADVLEGGPGAMSLPDLLWHMAGKP